MQAEAMPPHEEHRHRTHWPEMLARMVLGLLAVTCLVLAFGRFQSLETFHNPIAYAAQGPFFYVAEKDNNTILQLRIGRPGDPLRLEGAQSIEPDDGPHYFMVRLSAEAQ